MNNKNKNMNNKNKNMNNKNKENTFIFNKHTKYVGSYSITGKEDKNWNIRFMFVKKPNILHRFFCRILLGWFWTDGI